MANLNEELGSRGQPCVERSLPCHVGREILWRAAVVLACWTVQARLQEHVVNLCTEIDSPETKEEASGHPSDPRVLQNVAGEEVAA